MATKGIPRSRKRLREELILANKELRELLRQEDFRKQSLLFPLLYPGHDRKPFLRKKEAIETRIKKLIASARRNYLKWKKPS